LYEDVWIGVRDGRKLAERLGGAPDLANVVTVWREGKGREGEVVDSISRKEGG